MPMRIEDYALVGDCETAALVGRDGSIDWLCWPDFSSPACFTALLGTRKNGRWLIAPTAKPKRITRKYRDHTLILETVFETTSGTVLLIDFMPVREKHSDVIRLVRGMAGTVEMRMELLPRFDYGRTVPWTSVAEDGSWCASAGPGITYLRTQTMLQTRNDAAYAAFAVTAGDEVSFTLTYCREEEAVPERVDVPKALSETIRFWTGWCAANRYSGPWQDSIQRSLITLKALTYRPSGGVVAAPTTSLPEVVGGDRNWDYRYCWLRDATFTLESLISMGYHEEAKSWQHWLLQSIGSSPRQMQIMYGVRGERHLPEHELEWLSGYRRSKPVRIGNAASKQAQRDVYGEVADALFRIKEAGIPDNERVRRLRVDLTEHLSAIWRQSGPGIWEERHRSDHFTYSKVMAWVTLDRAIRGTESQGLEGDVKRWKNLRERIHQEVCKRGFNKRLNSFVQYYGAVTVDASSLLIPIFGFLPFDDDRVLGTVRVIEKKLMRDGLLMRRPFRAGKQRDSCFLAASFWLVQNRAMTGRLSEAEDLFERLLALQNDVGLLAEEYDPHEGRSLGNFPQALSHIALINAGRTLSECQKMVAKK